MVSRQCHELEKAGSIPAPAIKQDGSAMVRARIL